MSTQIERDAVARKEQQPQRMDITLEDPQVGIIELTLFGPNDIIDIAQVMFKELMLLHAKNELKPMTRQLVGEIQDLLRERVEEIVGVTVLDLRSVPMERSNIARFRLKFHHAVHGIWVIELPPTNSGSLTRV